MKRNLFVTLVVLLFLGFALVNCNTLSSNNALVGEWDDGEETVIKFFKDGSGILIEDKSEEKFTWTARENGVIVFNFDGEIQSIDYKISGSVLTLDGDDYKKKR